jgi:V8-like Glu-specific endopeptidase
MRLRGFRPAALALGAVAAIAAVIMLTPVARSATTERGQLAQFGRTSTVGALFTLTASGRVQHHFCTASVVDSPAGNLVVTAAHCMQGRRPGQVAFVPDYSAGDTPYGVWAVSRVIEDRRWQAAGDPDDDFAFLIVRKPGSTVTVEDLTGGEIVGISEPAGRPVQVAGYPNVLDTPVSCKNTVTAYSDTQYEFDCDGFTDGTSGSPLLARQPAPASGGNAGAGGVAVVIGVIGGYEQGGYTASVSYAARFGSSLAALYRTALAVSPN